MPSADRAAGRACQATMASALARAVRQGGGLVSAPSRRTCAAKRRFVTVTVFDWRQARDSRPGHCACAHHVGAISQHDLTFEQGVRLRYDDHAASLRHATA